jgi:hypothetical protein
MPSYAVQDAVSLRESLVRGLRGSGAFSEVTGVSLLSERAGEAGGATFAGIRDALAQLAGRAVASGGGEGIPDGLSPVGPDDLLMVCLCGHGYLAGTGVYYFLPEDIGAGPGGAVTDSLLQKSISDIQLSEWLRPIDVGGLVLVLDACQSAGAVATRGFKAGPLGSRGLGQLAYDKEMKLLAATESADVAIESGSLQHGLLSYVLAIEGLDAGRADFAPADGKITLDEWLAYAIERVPQIDAEVISGRLPNPVSPHDRIRRGLASVDGPFAQQPVLFDFASGRPPVNLEVSPAGGK